MRTKNRRSSRKRKRMIKRTVMRMAFIVSITREAVIWIECEAWGIGMELGIGERQVTAKDG